MGVVDATVDHSHDDITRAGTDLPRLGCVNVGVGSATPLPSIMKPVEIAEPGIVGQGVGRKRRDRNRQVRLEGRDERGTAEERPDTFGEICRLQQQLPWQAQSSEHTKARRGGTEEAGSLGHTGNAL